MKSYGTQTLYKKIMEIDFYNFAMKVCIHEKVDGEICTMLI